MNKVELEAFLSLIATPSLPDIGPRTRAGILAQPELTQKLQRHFREHQIDSTRQKALTAAALLWHDHLDASHEISQSLPDPNGSFLHGMMHRREPDYSNARYWFHRVERHPAFNAIAERVSPLKANSSSAHDLVARMVRGGSWHPEVFIEACEEAAQLRAKGEDQALLQRIQAIEFEELLRCL